MKQITLLLFILLARVALAQQMDEYNQSSGISWNAKSAACVALCISGDCDKTGLCDPFTKFHEAAKQLDVNHAVYISGKQFFLKEAFKKYLAGNTWETKTLRVLADADDRVFVYMIAKPAVLDPSKANDNAPLLKVNSIPVGLTDLEKPGDLLLGKIPDNMTDSFEVGINYTRYCKKLLCDVWHPLNQTMGFSKQMDAYPYPHIPLLLDTLSAPSTEVYSPVKTIALNIPFQHGRNTFSTDEIRALLAQLYEPEFKIRSINTTVYSNIVGDTLQSKKQQQGLAEKLTQVLLTLPEAKGAKTKTTIGSGWNKFANLIGNTGLFALAQNGPAAFKKKTDADPLILKKIVPILNDLQSIKVSLEVSLDSTKYNETQYWRTRMKKALEADREDLALSYQKPLIRLCMQGKLQSAMLLPTQMQVKAEWMSIWNNRAAMEKKDTAVIVDFQALLKIDPNNPLIKFNLLAAQLNFIDIPDPQLYDDEMLKFTESFSSINSSSVPAQLYAIMHARFYYFEIYGRKDPRILTFKDFQSIIKQIPPIEILKLSDHLSRLLRYDLAKLLVEFAGERIPATDHDLMAQYAMRMLYYTSFSGKSLTDAELFTLTELIQKADPNHFIEHFSSHRLPYLLLGIKRIRALYRMN